MPREGFAETSGQRRRRRTVEVVSRQSIVIVESMCFFFQAEDGIRDYKVTGVQTCALPIWACGRRAVRFGGGEEGRAVPAAWRERRGAHGRGVRPGDEDAPQAVALGPGVV